ncbi:MAG TPA: sulfotransferase [Thermoleophilaceae bacterium]
MLGMHRSGTSLVAGLMRDLGIDLGPDEALLPPDSNNPSGYFELTELVHLNNEILAHYGGSWDELPELPPGWENSEELAAIRDRARRLLSRRFAASSHWGWKDPRTCVTLPFWQGLAPDLRYVICVRNPVDVAHSLRTREGDERGLAEHALDWLRHTASALAYTAGRPRVVVHYERFFEDGEHELRRLAAFLGCEDRLDDPERMSRIREFINPALVHARSASAAIADYPAMPFEVAALYLALNLVADLEAGAGRAVAPEAWAGIDALAGRNLRDTLRP